MYALKKKTATERRLEYQCQQCFTDFCLLGGAVVSCPNCESHDLSQMVIIYCDDDPEMDTMLTRADMSAGD